MNRNYSIEPPKQHIDWRKRIEDQVKKYLEDGGEIEELPGYVQRPSKRVGVPYDN